MKLKPHPVFICLLLSTVAMSPAADQAVAAYDSPVVHFDAGLNYSRGDYGLSEDTEIFLGLVTATAETAAWRLQALAPFINIDGPAAVIAGGAQGTGVPGRPNTGSATGLGDVTLGATYKFGAVFGNNTTVDVGAQLKLPTGSESRGLGTGETDAYFQADFRHPLGNLTPFATLGYRFLGSNAQYPLENGLFVSLGAVRRLTASTFAGASYNWRERIIRRGDHASEALGFFLHQLNERWRLQGYVLAGFTNASPDFGTGLSLGYRF